MLNDHDLNLLNLGVCIGMLREPPPYDAAYTISELRHRLSSLDPSVRDTIARQMVHAHKVPSVVCGLVLESEPKSCST